jgi:hypothetical protein
MALTPVISEGEEAEKEFVPPFGIVIEDDPHQKEFDEAFERFIAGEISLEQLRQLDPMIRRSLLSRFLAHLRI